MVEKQWGLGWFGTAGGSFGCAQDDGHLGCVGDAYQAEGLVVERLRSGGMMQRGIRGADWVLFALTMYLILVGAVWPWVHLRGVGDIGFTLSLVLFTLLHCVALEGPRRTGAFFAISAVVSWGMEEVGVRTGLIFGSYHYGRLLGPMLGDVPVLIPLAWFMMIYPSWMVARALLEGIDTKRLGGLTALAVVAAMVMTAWDVVMDPGMAAAGNWVWEKGGAYFGVPRHNYLGWLVTTFVVYWLAGWLWRSVPRERGVTRGFESLPVVLYAFFGLRYMLWDKIAALQVIAVFAMGMPALLALVRVFVKQPEGTAI